MNNKERFAAMLQASDTPFVEWELEAIDTYITKHPERIKDGASCFNTLASITEAGYGRGIMVPGEGFLGQYYQRPEPAPVELPSIPLKHADVQRPELYLESPKKEVDSNTLSVYLKEGTDIHCDEADNAMTFFSPIGIYCTDTSGGCTMIPWMMVKYITVGSHYQVILDAPSEESMKEALKRQAIQREQKNV